MLHMKCDMWHMTCDMWHVTCDMWHVTCDILWGMNILSKFQLLLFVIYDNMKIWRKRLTDWMNQWINHEAVYRTAPATPGLLNLASNTP